VLSKGHNKSVDYWALGCLVYELLVGTTPFQDQQQPKIFEKIIHCDKHLCFPDDFDPEAQDLIKRLLTPNPSLRLGSLAGGVQDIMDHQWYRSASFKWEDLYQKKLSAPYKPPINDPLDTSNFDPYPEDDRIVRCHDPRTPCVCLLTGSVLLFIDRICAVVC
jgi:cGMP-dependent protein kinase